MPTRPDEGTRDVAIKRAYSAPEAADGWRVLVDRVWPRGMTREALALDAERSELAPSSELRRWFGHDPARWEEFARRYRAELAAPAAAAALDELADRASRGRVTLVYSARDELHNQARVIAEVLEERSGRPGSSGAVPPIETAAGAAADAMVTPVADAVERLIRTGVAITTRALEERPAVGLTLQQWRVLVIVAEAEGLRISAIAERVGQSLPSASRLVRRLEASGLIVIERDPGDARASLVGPSPRGRRVVDAVLERRRRLVSEALSRTPVTLPAGSVAVLEALADALGGLA